MVKFIGNIVHEKVNKLYSSARAGIMIYQPAANHIEALPNKLFEFMAAGLPVIASDFPLWKNIIDDAQCGITVDPTDAKSVREACEYLLDHPEEGQTMGMHGFEKVTSIYNWEVEENKLFDLYSSL